MKGKMFGAASIALAAATLAMPSSASAAECEPNVYTCVEEAVDLVQATLPKVIDQAQAAARDAATKAGQTVTTACGLVLPGC